MKTIACPWCGELSPIEKWKENAEHMYHICMPMSHLTGCPKCGGRTVFGPMDSIEQMERYKENVNTY